MISSVIYGLQTWTSEKLSSLWQIFKYCRSDASTHDRYSDIPLLVTSLSVREKSLTSLVSGRPNKWAQEILNIETIEWTVWLLFFWNLNLIGVQRHMNQPSENHKGQCLFKCNGRKVWQLNNMVAQISINTAEEMYRKELIELLGDILRYPHGTEEMHITSKNLKREALRDK